MVLCNRCHFAKQKGKILCLKCGEHYHSPRYENCFNCQPESFKENYYKSIEPQIREEITNIIQELQNIGINSIANSIQSVLDSKNLSIREIELQVSKILDKLEKSNSAINQ